MLGPIYSRFTLPSKLFVILYNVYRRGLQRVIPFCALSPSNKVDTESVKSLNLKSLYPPPMKAYNFSCVNVGDILVNLHGSISSKLNESLCYEMP